MIKKLYILTIFLALCYFDNSEAKSFSESSTDSLSKIMIILNTLSSDVDSITGKISNPYYSSIIEEFTILNDSAYCLFEDVSVGEWTLDVSAYYQDELTYQGITSAEVFQGKITDVNVFMKKVNNVGNLHVGLIWDIADFQKIIYDFDNGSLSGWSGPAKAEILQGKLHLFSIQGFKYHNINYRGRSNYTRGTIEVDILPQNGRYSFETKGNSISNNILEWSIFTQFRNDSIFVSQYDNNKSYGVFTNYIYKQNTWYTLRFVFNNERSEKGQFEFWIKPRNDFGPETYLGTFNFHARHGKLKGIYQFVVSTGDPNERDTMEGIFDNIKFFVK